MADDRGLKRLDGGGACKEAAEEGSSGMRFHLQPADPFDLIRWLARTQSDPRKAVAELVQNSIDAGARTIAVERRRVRGRPALIVRDDGQGVLPDRGREEALRHIGTHIGHSHKLGLSPSERHERVVAGQYGVGLLGFWAVGRQMELRSRVAGSQAHVLTLVEDRPVASLGRMPIPLDAPDTFTEVAILELHEAALRPLVGRRLADYLAAELRGAILQSGVSLEIRDHLARGLAQKHFCVTPRRFDGVRLDVPSEIAVDGYGPIQLELYLARGAERAAIQVACAGTLVASDIAELAALGFGDPPWSGGEVTGIVEFGGFQVPPGTRRGVIPNAAAAAFARAMTAFEPVLWTELHRVERDRRAISDRHLVGELRRAMRGLRERLPHYDLPDVGGAGGEAGDLPVGARVTAAPKDEGPLDGAPTDDVQPHLFPPGPLAAVTIAPRRIGVRPGGERRVQARPVDAEGRPVREGVRLEWSLDHPAFAVRGPGARPAVTAAAEVIPGAEATLYLVARQGDCAATARATVAVAVVGEGTARGGVGIPRPELVDAPGAAWRSRMNAAAWQVNAGHEDYVALGDGRGRVRYLVALLGKEMVAATYSQPGAGELLEHLVAVVAHAERNLQGS